MISSLNSPATDALELDADDAKPSRSQIKREHLALQSLAEQLLALPRRLLEELSFSELTWVAINETARIKDQRALRRHYKRIANCLARENTEPLQALLAQREAQARAATARQHEVERWRERLIEEGDEALAELISAYPEVDRQQLRSLVRAAQRDAERGRPEAPRRLFRQLRTLLDAHQQ
ncbi:ribosome biogenesis factor YjgA [Lamprobacter modestohalophilus]|uniref:ribosome biogenesis factor YjgA n=1 Tax=Lamprobacter modestohalophilus TaxID=1064514 RepID=UPI002ADEF9D5|nr:ribosome biogenesis factor YjgA [Lamprobacter modestohalophilus]MEA1049512.1 ribosome biogenesis factor YjgA [Lamprobacter modestohalophilus]